MNIHLNRHRLVVKTLAVLTLELKPHSRPRTSRVCPPRPRVAIDQHRRYSLTFNRRAASFHGNKPYPACLSLPATTLANARPNCRVNKILLVLSTLPGYCFALKHYSSCNESACSSRAVAACMEPVVNYYRETFVGIKTKHSY